MTQGSGVGIFPAGGGASLIQYKQKVDDESKSNDVVFADDDVLAGFVVSAGKLYCIEAHIIAFSTSATPDIKFRLFSAAAASNPTFGSIAKIMGASVAGAQMGVSAQTIASLTGGVALHMQIKHAYEPTADGLLAFQWAQNVSNATPTIVTESSWMKLTEAP